MNKIVDKPFSCVPGNITRTMYSVDGKYHRLDGPAIETAYGHKEWWLNGERQRIDGPAYERADGDKSWWMNGKQYTEEEYNKLMLGV